jgi:hypothetical protein
VSPSFGWRAETDVPPRPSFVVPAVIIAALMVAAVALVAISLGREPPPMNAPTVAPAPADSTDPRPRVYTIDATSGDFWVFFSFEQGGIVPQPDARAWDLGFRRFHIIANGGEGFPGDGGVIDLGPVDFASIDVLPDSGYTTSKAARDSSNAAIARWYRYGFTTHMLSPGGRVYGVRAADGRYAKLEVLGYYCPGPVAGCVTIRYAFQPRGGRTVGEDAYVGASARGSAPPETGRSP